MELDELPRQYHHLSGVTRAQRGGHTLSVLTEVGPMRAPAAVNGRKLHGTRWVCLTEGLACASTAGQVVTVDQIGRAVVGIIFF